MTCREKLKQEYPECVSEAHNGGCDACPETYGYLADPSWCIGSDPVNCIKCWDREIPEDKSGIQKAWEKIQENVRVSSDEKIVRTPLRVCTSATATMTIKANKPESIYKLDENDDTNESTMWPKENPHILDSGNRREFETGAVRDIQEGKGRCDLMPLDVVSRLLDDDKVLLSLHSFKTLAHDIPLYSALKEFCSKRDTVRFRIDEKDEDRIRDLMIKTGLSRSELMRKALNNGREVYGYSCIADAMLEVSKHFEEGAKKYGENNWQKGIPTHCYIDSAVRHYLKYLRGDKDEPHDRAFIWNVLCCAWTCKHKPELNDCGEKDTDNDKS